jgi:hypothetical protein
MLAQNPANSEALCAEKSMPACLVVSPNLKRGAGAQDAESDAVDKGSAASFDCSCKTADCYDIATSSAAADDSTASLPGREPAIHCSYHRVRFNKLHKKNA